MEVRENAIEQDKARLQAAAMILARGAIRVAAQNTEQSRQEKGDCAAAARENSNDAAGDCNDKP